MALNKVVAVARDGAGVSIASPDFLVSSQDGLTRLDGHSLAEGKVGMLVPVE